MGIPGLTISHAPPHGDISMLAQKSLKEVRKLRAVVNTLMTSASLDNANKSTVIKKSEDMEDDSAEKTENESSVNQILTVRSANIGAHNVMQVGGVLEHGVQSALSVMNTAHQLEFDNKNSLTPLNEKAVVDPRRIDWLTDRPEVASWFHRNHERTKVALEHLSSCSIFQRNQLQFVDRISINLESLLNEYARMIPDTIFTVIDSDPDNFILHLKVGDVFHCLLTFSSVVAENVIIRGLDESMCVRTSSVGSLGLCTPYTICGGMNYSTISYGSSVGDSIQVPSGEIPDSNDNGHGSAGGSSKASRKNPSIMYGPKKLNFVTKLIASQIDLFTPSRHQLFRRITDLARSALLHFSSDTEPACRLDRLFRWLNSYRSLFSEPCMRCNQLIGLGPPPWALHLPIWRGFGDRNEPLHEHCQATPSRLIFGLSNHANVSSTQMRQEKSI